jgi:hypothetical protein
MKTFVDNVCRQVIERHIIAKLPSAFEPILVSEYKTEELLRIAAESTQVSIHRDEARHFQEVLEKSLEDLSVQLGSRGLRARFFLAKFSLTLSRMREPTYKCYCSSRAYSCVISP